ncbi:MAG: translational GTPase TypA [Eubacteriales bacterium]|jgi:GTP-binding protein|nr:translational GTPase TypA [Oscillospiraceae bacterium]MBR2598124.1 translational GTPase TypA [Clostridiales bacterium]MDO4421060.1 translational GTPase TypA [Eubacteriales bacterium]
MAVTTIENLRNIAIIAHVDHGKTTIVDSMLKQAGVYRENEAVVEQVMDSNDLERERGITILAKNTAIDYKGIRINVVDTPGHADFGGEVERVLKMVDSVLLVVDAFDGPMPQTRFVLHKALGLGLKPIVCINKIDRPDARPLEVVDMVLDLFIELGADDEQLEFPVVYTSGKTCVATLDLKEYEEGKELDFTPLLDTVVKYTPCPVGDPEGPMQLLVSNIDSDPYIGRIGVGRVERGTIKQGENVALVTYGEDGKRNARVVKLLRFHNLGREEVASASIGEIVCVAGIADINIGDTLCDANEPEPLPFVKIDEPTIAMTFSVNDSPFAGQEGKFVTSRHLRDRLFKEIETNVSMRVEETDTTEAFIVKGRGELHLSVLIETMRREGYEFQVSKPKVIMQEIDGVLCEPVEELVIDVPEEFVGPVMEKIGKRKGELLNMLPPTKGYTRLEFKIPSRGLLGYRTEFLTDTKGNGIMNSVISGFEPFAGDIETRGQGVLVAFETGTAVTYGLYNAQDRGALFIGAGTPVYEGMIVGINPKPDDITVNVCKKKHVTNMRSAGADDAMRLTPPLTFSLEQCLEFVEDDELCEVTPKSIRLRKKILNNDLRAKTVAKAKKDV